MDILTSFFDTAKDFLLSVLPLSPFKSFIEGIQLAIGAKYLGWLNWFVPVGQILGVLAAWLSAIALFYMYSIIMRWVKVIGD